MKHSRAVLFVVAGLILWAPPVGAAILPVTAAYTIEIIALPAVTISGGSGIGTSNGFGGSATLPAGIFAGNPAVVVPVSPSQFGLTSITVPANSVGNPAGSFAPNGAMGLSGSLFFNGGSFGSLPLGPMGGGGTSPGTIDGVKVKLLGATWMYAVSKVFTGMGAALANAISVTATAFDNRTAGGQGTLQLVAGSGNLLISGSPGLPVPIFATLTLTYTPEPATLLLLGSGVALLGTLGRSKRRR